MAARIACRERFPKAAFALHYLRDANSNKTTSAVNFKLDNFHNNNQPNTNWREVR